MRALDDRARRRRIGHQLRADDVEGCVLAAERYGLAQHTKDLAVRFASEGHIALAPNLYFREPDQEALLRGEGRAETTDEQVRTLAQA